MDWPAGSPSLSSETPSSARREHTTPLRRCRRDRWSSARIAGTLPLLALLDERRDNVITHRTLLVNQLQRTAA